MRLIDIALMSLRRRKAKAGFVLAGLMVGVATMVGLISLAQGLTHEIAHKMEKYGANILVTPRSDSLALSYEGVNLGGFSFKTQEIRQDSLTAIHQIENAANLAAVGPVVLGPVEAAGKPAMLAGVDFATSRYLKPWWKLNGRPAGQGEVVLGSEAARLLGLTEGSAVEIKDRRLVVSGVLDPTGSQDDRLIFTPLAQAQQLLGKAGLVSMVEVAALCKDCPVEAMVAQIGRALPGARVTAIQSVVKGRMETLGRFKSFGMGVSALVALVGGLVVLVTMMASVKERTGEIGVFRAIGFRRSHVMTVVLSEAAALSVAAGILGWAIGSAAAGVALPVMGQGGASLSLDLWLAGAALALSLVAGLAASIYPALWASRLDPAQALRTI